MASRRNGWALKSTEIHLEKVEEEWKSRKLIWCETASYLSLQSELMFWHVSYFVSTHGWRVMWRRRAAGDVQRSDEASALWTGRPAGRNVLAEDPTAGAWHSPALCHVRRRTDTRLVDWTVAWQGSRRPVAEALKCTAQFFFFWGGVHEVGK